MTGEKAVFGVSGVGVPCLWKLAWRRRGMIHALKNRKIPSGYAAVCFFGLGAANRVFQRGLFPYRSCRHPRWSELGFPVPLRLPASCVSVHIINLAPRNASGGSTLIFPKYEAAILRVAFTATELLTAQVYPVRGQLTATLYANELSS